jgi:hypothetical protein
VTGAAELTLIHLVVCEAHASTWKQGWVTGETQVLIVLQVREYPSRGRIGLAVFFHNGDDYLCRQGKN